MSRKRYRDRSPERRAWIVAAILIGIAGVLIVGAILVLNNLSMS